MRMHVTRFVSTRTKLSASILPLAFAKNADCMSCHASFVRRYLCLAHSWRVHRTSLPFSGCCAHKAPASHSLRRHSLRSIFCSAGHCVFAPFFGCCTCIYLLMRAQVRASRISVHLIIFARFGDRWAHRTHQHITIYYIYNHLQINYYHYHSSVRADPHTYTHTAELLLCPAQSFRRDLSIQIFHRAFLRAHGSCWTAELASVNIEQRKHTSSHRSPPRPCLTSKSSQCDCWLFAGMIENKAKRTLSISIIQYNSAHHSNAFDCDRYLLHRNRCRHIHTHTHTPALIRKCV